MFVGISERTNKAGAAALAKAFGPSLPVIPVPVVRKREAWVGWLLVRPAGVFAANGLCDFIFNRLASVACISERAAGLYATREREIVCCDILDAYRRVLRARPVRRAYHYLRCRSGAVRVSVCTNMTVGYSSPNAGR